MKNGYNDGHLDLYRTIDKINTHPEALKKDIIKVSSIEHFKKNQFIVSPGDISRHCYFIIDGFVRIFHDFNRKEVTTWFLSNHDFMLQLHGFYLAQKSPEYLQATEDTICIKMHIDDQRRLFSKYPIFKDTYIQLTQLYYLQLTERDAWKVYTAKEKYQKLLKEYPHIIQKGHGAHVASYLGIAETYYSKIRNNRL